MKKSILNDLFLHIHFLEKNKAKLEDMAIWGGFLGYNNISRKLHTLRPIDKEDQH